ncbi:hypothetical protein ACFS07_06625 [Undibacterium arcticum]
MVRHGASTGFGKTMATVPAAIVQHGADHAVVALLARFELDKLPAEIQDHVEAGYAADEAKRTLNIAFRLITIKKISRLIGQ